MAVQVNFIIRFILSAGYATWLIKHNTSGLIMAITLYSPTKIGGERRQKTRCVSLNNTWLFEEAVMQHGMYINEYLLSYAKIMF
jgi:hypothetical protein